MTDRELLELAAKALGAPELMDGAEYGLSGMEWNPLQDDGDALRLAVKLGLHLFHSKHQVRCGRKTIDTFAEESKREQDPLVATRRAIVRAAAVIGRGEQ